MAKVVTIWTLKMCFITCFNKQLLVQGIFICLGKASQACFSLSVSLQSSCNGRWCQFSEGFASGINLIYFPPGVKSMQLPWKFEEGGISECWWSTTVPELLGMELFILDSTWDTSGKQLFNSPENEVFSLLAHVYIYFDHWRAEQHPA